MLTQNQYICAGIIIVLLLLIIYINITTFRYHEKFLFGSWESDPSFNTSSDIKTMKIFIGDNTNSFACFSILRDSYIHIDNTDNTNITSHVFQLSYNTISTIMRNFSLSLYRNIYSYQVHLAFEDNFTLIPKDLTMDLDIINGYLLLYDADDNLFASLYKDTSSSHLLNVQKNKDDSVDSASNNSTSNNGASGDVTTSDQTEI